MFGYVIKYFLAQPVKGYLDIGGYDALPNDGHGHRDIGSAGESIA
jgi:hypothetical protein